MKLKTAIVALSLMAAGSLASAQSTAQASSQAGSSQPSARGPIQTKTAAEYQAYQAAIANEKNPEAMEKAAETKRWP